MSRSSASKAVQDVWEVYLKTLRLVPVDVRVDLRSSCHFDLDVDLSWSVWCKAAEAGLLTAFKAAEAPFPQGDPAFWVGRAAVRTRKVGGRAPGWLQRSAKADAVDSSSCHAFINSSLAPVVLLRRRLQSVGDVLQGMRKDGFSTARWQALMLRWAAVCRQGPHYLPGSLAGLATH